MQRAPAFLCALAALGIAGCGGGERQDANEPSGRYQVEVVDAAFPTKQKLAKRSDLNIRVKNTGRKTVPNIAVTVRGFNRRLESTDVSDASRPVFVVNGQPKRIGDFAESKEAAPEGGETAYVGTWALGPLKPGQEKNFGWSVTAVKAGPFRLSYEIAAGLGGKAKAVNEFGQTPRGLFLGNVSDEAPDTRIADDGRTVVEGNR